MRTPSHRTIAASWIRPGSRPIAVLALLAWLLSGCVSLPNNDDRVASYAFTDTGDTLLGRGFVESDDIRMRKSGRDLGLGDQAVDLLRIAQPLRM